MCKERCIDGSAPAIIETSRASRNMAAHSTASMPAALPRSLPGSRLAASCGSFSIGVIGSSLVVPGDYAQASLCGRVKRFVPARKALDSPPAGGATLGHMATALTIGEFSRITHLSIKTLRRYHEAGLLEPAHVDRQTGYRYYSADQAPPAHLTHPSRDPALPSPPTPA